MKFPLNCEAILQGRTKDYTLSSPRLNRPCFYDKLIMNNNLKYLENRILALQPKPALKSMNFLPDPQPNQT